MWEAIGVLAEMEIRYDERLILLSAYRDQNNEFKTTLELEKKSAWSLCESGFMMLCSSHNAGKHGVRNHYKLTRLGISTAEHANFLQIMKEAGR